MSFINLKSKNLLKRKTFYQIILILFVLAILFLMVVNLLKAVGIFRASQATDDPQAGQNLSLLVENLNALEQGKNGSIEEAPVCILGGEAEELSALAQTQVENMKLSCYQAENTSALTIEQRVQTNVFLVTSRISSIEEIRQLQSWVGKGKHVIFLAMPSQALLSQNEVQDFLGIRSYNGEETYNGYRTAKELLLGKVQELKKIRFTASDIVLGRRTKVFCSALVKDESVKNEDLPPLIWRYIPDGDQGSVYVCNGDLVASSFGYGVISALFCDMEDVYLYPVVNAYCFFVEGMPYTDNFESEVLTKWYSRDAIGFQRDLLFPQLTRCADLYGINPTWYTPEYDSLSSSNLEDVTYILDEIKQGNGELGKLENGVGITGEELIANAGLWQLDFSFLGKQKSTVSLPILLDQISHYNKQRMNLSGMVRGTGFLSELVDVSEFVYNEDLSDSDKNWADYCLELETVLGTDQQDYGWLDRVTASEAAQRVAAFLVMQPQYDYYDAGVTVTIGQFHQAAYFIMKTDTPVKEVKNGSFTEIGEHLYLIEANEDFIEILYE